MAFTSVQDFIDWFSNEETKDKPAEITTPNEFNLMADYLHANQGTSSTPLRQFVQVNNLDFEGGTIHGVIGGNYGTLHSVLYNGNFCEIVNVGEITTHALFSAHDMTVKNLTVRNCKFEITGDFYAFYDTYGGVTGEKYVFENINFTNNKVICSGLYRFVGCESGSSTTGNGINMMSTNSIIQCGRYVPYANNTSSNNCSYYANLDIVEINPTSPNCAYLVYYAIRYGYSRPKIKINNNSSTTAYKLYLSYDDKSRNKLQSYMAPQIELTNQENKLTVQVFYVSSASTRNNTTFFDKSILPESQFTITNDCGLGLTTEELKSEAIMKSKGWNIVRLN